MVSLIIMIATIAGGGKSSVVDAAAPDGGPTSWILACTAVGARQACSPLILLIFGFASE